MAGRKGRIGPQDIYYSCGWKFSSSSHC